MKKFCSANIDFINQYNHITIRGTAWHDACCNNEIWYNLM